MKTETAGPARGGAGFTLIELMAAMTILVLMVLMTSIIFSDSQKAWNLATGRADVNMAGRAAIDMITHDLQYAIAYSTNLAINPTRPITIPFRMDVVDTKGKTCMSHGSTNSEVYFISLQGNPTRDKYGDGTKRAAAAVAYYVREAEGRYYLRRCRLTEELNSTLFNDKNPYYRNPAKPNQRWYDVVGRDFGFGGADMAENVVGFTLFAPNPDGTGTMVNRYYSEAPECGNLLPEYVDVCLELLNDRDAERALALSQDPEMEEQCLTFVERNARRFTTRVYFHNRDGYRSR